ncbi:MAG: hypothetical protein IT189_09400 [Microbacteriaceae bacterium]|nr:hypothetical protein [Microbacteriaceae bacterium]
MTTPEFTRPELTRSRAYDYLGKPHFIPMKLGASWLKADLVSTRDVLPLGGTTTLDYRGDLADAPHFTLSRTPADLVVLRSRTGPMDAAGNHHWNWPPSALPDCTERIAHDILGAILERRDAPWVVLVPPRWAPVSAATRATR